MVRASAAAMLIALGALMAACAGGDAPKTPTAAATASATSTAPPVAPSTLVPAPTPAPLPTVEPPALKLRLVNVATGANSDLPVGFGGFSHTRAWSFDSTRIAVAHDEGLSFGLLAAPRFMRLWDGPCRAADWSSGGDRIAAACQGAFAILDLNGKLIARDSTLDAEWASFPPWVDWSPEGRFVAYGTANSEVRLMDAAGRRTTVPGSFRDAKWLSDGRLVTIEQLTYRDAATVRIHDPARDYAVVATAVTPAGAAGLGIDREGKYAAYGVIGPSRGDQRILPSTVTILRIADGQVVATFPTYAGYGEIDFSPDGQSILMQSDYCGPNWSLEIGGLDGSRRVIARGSFMSSKFSPDGSQVGFLRGTELWVVPADGSALPRRIAEGVHGPASFDWSPDGRWISVPPYFGGFDQCP